MILDDVGDFRFRQIRSVGTLLQLAKQTHVLRAELEKLLWRNNHGDLEMGLLLSYLRLVPLKPLIFEFQGFAILGDGASDVVWNATLNSGLNLQRHFHICIEEAC